MSPNTIRIVVIDDHLIARQGIIGLLRSNPNIEVVAEGWAGEHVLSLLQTYKPDVLLTDLQMPMWADKPSGPLFSPLTILQQAIKSYPQTAVIVISQEQDVYLVSNLAEVGVKGYFLKSDNFTETLGVVVQQIYEGGAYFSPIIVKIIEAAPLLKQDLPLSNAEMNVLRALLRWPELGRKAQAELLHIIPSTLQKHIKSIITKLNVPNVESCLVKAMRMGMVYKGETIEEPFERND